MPAAIEAVDGRDQVARNGSVVRLSGASELGPARRFGLGQHPSGSIVLVKTPRQLRCRRRRRTIGAASRCTMSSISPRSRSQRSCKRRNGGLDVLPAARERRAGRRAPSAL